MIISDGKPSDHDVATFHRTKLSFNNYKTLYDVNICNRKCFARNTNLYFHHSPFFEARNLPFSRL